MANKPNDFDINQLDLNDPATRQYAETQLDLSDPDTKAHWDTLVGGRSSAPQGVPDYTKEGPAPVQSEPAAPKNHGLINAIKDTFNESVEKQGGWGLTPENAEKLGFFGAKWGPMDTAARALTGLNAALETGAQGLDAVSEATGLANLPEKTGLDKLMGNPGGKLLPGSALMALGEAMPDAGMSHGALTPPKLSPEALAQRRQFISESTDLFNKGADRAAMDEHAAKYGMGQFGGDLDSAIEVRNKTKARGVVLDDTREALAQSAPKPNKTGRYGPKSVEKLDQRKEAVGKYIDQVVEDEGLKNAPDFEIIGHVNDIADETIRKDAAQSVTNDTLGFLGPDGKVRIFANKVKSPEELSGILYHEALGHYGLAEKFGSDVDGLISKIYDNNLGDFTSKVDNWLERNPSVYKGDPNRVIRAGEEVLAEMSEKGKIDNKIVDLFSNKIKEIGRDMGLDLKYSDRETKTILGMAHDAVVQGEPSAAANGFRYKIDETPAPQLTRREKILNASKELELTEPGETRTLRPFPDEEPTYHRFRHVTEDGKVVRGNYHVENGKLEDLSIDSSGGPRSIGVSTIRKIGRDLLAEHPEASAIGGYRMTGARKGVGSGPEFVESSNRFMTKKIKEETPDFEDVDPIAPEDIRSPSETLKVLEEDYEPTVRSWDDAKRAARDRGISAKQIRKSKTVGELDKRLYLHDQAAKVTDSKIAKLNDKFDSGNFTAKDKATYLQTVYEWSETLGRLFDDQAEVGRALNIIKTLQFTKKKVGALNEILAEHGGIAAAFADEETFLKFRNQIASMMDGGNPAGARQMMANVVKPYWWQYVLSFRHASMLSGLATHAKNVTDNGLMIAREFEEALLSTPAYAASKATGGRSDKLLGSGVSPAEMAGRSYGLLRAALDSTTYKNTAEAFMKGHGNRALSSKVELADARIPVISKVSDALHAQDVFFRSFLENTNMYAEGIRSAQKDGFKGMAAFQEGANRAMNPTETMLKNAKTGADITLLVDSPSLPFAAKLEAMKAIRPGMTAAQQAEVFAANIALPFFRVTDRLLHQMIRRSPLSFLDKVTREDLAAGGERRSMAIARTLYGSALIYYYWKSAGEDKITGNDESYKKQRSLEAGGYMPNSVNEGDKNVDASALNLSFSPFDLHNATAAHVAGLRKAWDKGNKESAVEGLKAITKSFMATLSDNSFAENVSQYIEPFTAATQADSGKFDAAAGGLAGNIASSFVPAALRQTNQIAVDPIKRDATGDKSITDRVTGRVASSIPGLSDDLPVKYDVYGREQEQGRTVLGMSNYRKIDNDPTVKELQRLEKTTDKSVVTAAPTSIKINGETVKLDGEAYAEFQRVSGYYFLEGMKQQTKTEDFKKMSDPEKIAFTKKVLKEARKVAKEHLVEGLQEGEDDD